MTRLALLALGMLALGGCHADYAGLEIRLYTSTAEPIIATDQQIELPVGLAVAIEALPISGNRHEYDEDDRLDLRSEHEEILLAEPAEMQGWFVLVGVAPGETCIAVLIDGAREACIPARVNAPSG